MTYSSLTRAELSSIREKHKLAQLNIKLSSASLYSPTRPDEATIAVAQKDINDMLAALSLATTTTSSPTHTNTPQTYEATTVLTGCHEGRKVLIRITAYIVLLPI